MQSLYMYILLYKYIIFLKKVYNYIPFQYNTYLENKNWINTFWLSQGLSVIVTET